MTRYTEIIDRLGKATGPDRWLDARIDAALRIGTEKMRGTGYEWAWNNFPVWRHHLSAAGMCGVLHDNGDLGLIWDSEKFTASIDAAIALVERTLPWCEVDMTNLYGVARVTLHHEDSPFYGSDECNNFPIAILLALFQALEAQEAGK